MRRDRDIIERLAAADPVPGAERLTPEEEHDGDALLARLLAQPAEPDAPRGRPQHPRLRRLTLAVGGAAGAVAVAITAINLGDSDSPETGVVDQTVAARTVAAVTQENSVYHVVQRKRGFGNVEGANIGPFIVETWHASDGRMHEKVFRGRGGRRGRLLEEHAGKRPSGRGVGELLRYDPRQDKVYPSGIRTGDSDELPLIDPAGNPGANLRELQARGLLRVAGTTEVGGRRAYRLESDPVPRSGDSMARFEYVVDSETYLPLRQRYSLRRGAETLGFVSEFLVYERLPLDARSEAQLDLDAHPGATCALGAGEARKRELGFANPCSRQGRG
jgi:hypothetical protein